MYNLKLFTLILFLGCSTTKISFVEELEQKFNKGEKLYQDGKYTRAKDEFQFVVMNNPGSKWH